MKTRKLTTAQAIVEFLKNQYVKRDGKEHRLINGVFGIFGHGNVAGLGQALEELGGNELPYLQPKNEQAMVHLAAAYSKAKNRLGTYACTTSIGPGATNMVTAAAGATINRIPVLLLPGDIFANRKPDPVLQQLEHPLSMDTSVNDCFKPISVYWDRIERPEQILKALPEAMRKLSDPEQTGTVTISLPQDVQAETYDYPEDFFEKKIYIIHRNSCSQELIKEAASLIKNSKKPFIIAGGGVHYSEAEDCFKKLVDKTKIPVGVTQAGMGSLNYNNISYLGAVGVTGTLAANKIAKDADLVIAIGTRLSDFTTASKTQFQNENVSFINININSFDVNKHNALPLNGDVKAVIEDLIKSLQGYSTLAGYQSDIKKLVEEWNKEREKLVNPQKNNNEKLHQSEVIGILNEHSDGKTTIVHAAGGIPGDIHKLWKPKEKKDYHSEYGYSCMGYEIPGALGVKLANPERDIIAILGDGSYLMGNNTEIATSIQLGKKITVVLLDNCGYQCIHNLQKSCGSEGFGNEFRYLRDGKFEGEFVDIDYVKNAESLGAKTFKADTKEGLKKALNKARKETKTCLIYVPIEPRTSLPGYSWWDVAVAESSGQESVNKARKNYVIAKERQRLHYK